MRILGLDPGTRNMGYCVLDTSPVRRLVETGVLTSPQSKPRAQRVVDIGSDLRALFVEFKPDCVAVETAYWSGFAVASGALGEVRGVILWLSNEHRATVYDYAPKEVRRTIGVGGGADKAAVAAMVGRVLGLRRPLESDAGDACGVAMCHALRGVFEEKAQGKRALTRVVELL